MFARNARDVFAELSDQNRTNIYDSRWYLTGALVHWDEIREVWYPVVSRSIRALSKDLFFRFISPPIVARAILTGVMPLASQAHWGANARAAKSNLQLLCIHICLTPMILSHAANNWLKVAESWKKINASCPVKCISWFEQVIMVAY